MKRYPWQKSYDRLIGRREDFIASVLRDYFPAQMTVLDRDVMDSLVHATLAYADKFGLVASRSSALVRLDDGQAVELAALKLGLSRRAAWRLPRALLQTLVDLRNSPMSWLEQDLRGILADAVRLRRLSMANLSDVELLAVVDESRQLRDAVFITREKHFQASFALKIGYEVVMRNRLEAIASTRDLGGRDYPTARFRRDLERLVSVVKAGDSQTANEAAAAFLEEHGGRGNTFVPLVSDVVWDVSSEDFLALLPLLAKSEGRQVNRLTVGPTGRVTERLRTIAVARDWVAYGYEQATRPCRSALLELARRLVERGDLDEVRDIFHCRLEELREGASGNQVDLRSLVADRRQAYSRPAQQTVQAGGIQLELAGIAASPGRHTGRAQVIERLSDSARLSPGDILVCEMTSPAWLPLLMIASAVVTDRGGALSHAAIVAREFGVPAVTGTGSATSWLTSGAYFIVDGDSGLVRQVETPH